MKIENDQAHFEDQIRDHHKQKKKIARIKDSNKTHHKKKSSNSKNENQECCIKKIGIKKMRLQL